jgi:hypothetical protein
VSQVRAAVKLLGSLLHPGHKTLASAQWAPLQPHVTRVAATHGAELTAACLTALADSAPRVQVRPRPHPLTLPHNPSVSLSLSHGGVPHGAGGLSTTRAGAAPTPPPHLTSQP